MKKWLELFLFVLTGSLGFGQTASLPVSEPPPGTTQTVTNNGGKLVFSHKNCDEGNRSGSRCDDDIVTFSQPSAQTKWGSGEQDVHYISMHAFGPGTNNGANGLPNPSWTVEKDILVDDIIQRRGIWGGLSINARKYSAGDMNGIYNYITCATMPTGPADEGCTQINSQGGEPTKYFHGRISGRAGVGAIQPDLAFVSGDIHTIDGGILLDISKGTIAGNLAGEGTGKIAGAPFLRTIPVTNKLPISSAFGIASGIIDVSTLPTNPVSVVVPVKLQTFNGSTPPFTAGGTVCLVNSNYAEQALITAVSPASAGSQNLSLAVRQYYPAGTTIFQGGTCGQYMSFDTDLAFSGMRTSYYAFGSLDGKNLIYGANVWGFFLFGSPLILPSPGWQAQTADGPYHLYPGAEIVANSAIGAAPILEANSVNWSLGDTVESPHGAAFENNGLSVTVNQSTMSDGGLGSHLFQVLGNGRGIGPSATFMTIVNQQPCAAQYRACGGPISPPPLLNATGTFADLFHFSNGPSAGEFPEGDAVIFINKTAAGGKDDTPFQLFTLPYRGNSGYSGIEYFPATALFSFQGPIKDNVLQSNTHPLCTNGADGAFNNQGCGTLAISVTTTASSSDTFPLPGMTAAGHCSQPGATNTAAATATGTYISTKAANSVTLTHGPTPGMKFDLLCTPY